MIKAVLTDPQRDMLLEMTWRIRSALSFAATAVSSADIIDGAIPFDPALVDFLGDAAAIIIEPLFEEISQAAKGLGDEPRAARVLASLAEARRILSPLGREDATIAKSIIRMVMTKEQRSAVLDAVWSVRSALWFADDVFWDATIVDPPHPLSENIVSFLEEAASVLLEPLSVEPIEQVAKAGAKMSSARLVRLKQAVTILTDLAAELEGTTEKTEKGLRPARMALRIARIATSLLGKGLPLLDDTI